jgi:hypothetical protein
LRRAPGALLLFTANFYADSTQDLNPPLIGRLSR